jgi:hypothetical protein
MELVAGTREATAPAAAGCTDDASAGRQAEAGTQAFCFEGFVPPYAGPAIDRLYGSIYASVALLSIYDTLAQASTYVVRHDGDISCVLLYRRAGRQIEVLNQCIRLSHAEIEGFADTMFARHVGVDCIAFHAVQATLEGSRYPAQQFHCAADIVAELPDTAEAYLAQLSKNMRQATKYYLNRMRRLHPSFRFQVTPGTEIDEQEVRRIYRFNRERMEGKHLVPNVDDDEVGRIIALTRRSGLLMTATIEGRVCGGLVCWRAGDDVFLRSIAHDPAFDGINLGTVCCHLGIMECISRGAKRFHFLAGRLQYKYRFLGKDQNFDRIVLYRDCRSLVRQAGMAARTMTSGWSNEINLWLMNAERRDDRASRAAVRLLRAWRACKAWRKRLRGELPRPV